MKKLKFVFERKETKYLLDGEKYSELMDLLEEYICEDEFFDSTICNIYFDSDDFRLIRTSLDKPKYKEKLRLRSYGVPDDDSKVFLEIKKKFLGIVYKRRIGLSYDDAEDYLENDKVNFEKSQTFQEIDYFKNYYDVKPKVYIAYDRKAYVCKDDNSLRITFDSNIRSRDYDLDLRMGDYGEPLLPDGDVIMEIKIGDALPLWFTHILSKLEIYPTSFSKYGTVYQIRFINKVFKHENILYYSQIKR